jgi:hypothetical protein
LAYSLTSFLTSIGENEVIMSLEITHLFVRHVETINLCSRIETFGIVKNIAYMVWIMKDQMATREGGVNRRR